MIKRPHASFGMVFLSKPILLNSGVRQGGILRPPFFSIYVDGLFKILEDSGLGCFIDGFCVNSLMYADDLIIIAVTISDLKRMLCHSLFSSRCLPLNISKCVCVRFGPRHDAICVDIEIENDRIKWSTSFKYLGVHVIPGKTLK